MNELKELIGAAQAAFHAEDFETAENKARQALALSATATDAMTIMGGVQLWRQNFEEAASWFSRAMEAAPEKKELRSNLLLALGASAELKLSSGDVKGGLEGVRRILFHDVDDWDARNSLFSILFRAKESARLSDFVPPQELATLGGRMIFIACFPKSGSTYLNRLLQEISGFDYGHGVEFYTDNEQDLSYRRMAAAARTSCVMQHHTRATQANLQIMQGFGIRPIILVRNLYDMVFSVHDFMLNAGARGAVFGFPEGFQTLEDGRRLDYVIDMVMPWYVGFYVSWANAAQRGDVELHWIRYENLVDQPMDELQAIMDFCELPVFAGVIQTAVEHVNQNRDQTRFNKGIVGRGQALTEMQRQRLKNLVSYFPDVDFSRIMNPEPLPAVEKSVALQTKPVAPIYTRFF